MWLHRKFDALLDTFLSNKTAVKTNLKFTVTRAKPCK